MSPRTSLAADDEAELDEGTSDFSEFDDTDPDERMLTELEQLHVRETSTGDDDSAPTAALLADALDMDGDAALAVAGTAMDPSLDRPMGWSRYLTMLLDIDLMSTVVGEHGGGGAGDNTAASAPAPSSAINVNRVDGSQLNWLNPVTYVRLLTMPKPAQGPSAANDRNPKRATFQGLREVTMVRSRRRLLTIFTLYTLALRYVSTDAYLLILLFSNCLLLYYLKNARRINLQLAKRSVRQRVGWAKQWAGGFFKRGTQHTGDLDDGAGLGDDLARKDDKPKKRRNPFRKNPANNNVSHDPPSQSMQTSASTTKRLGIFRRNTAPQPQLVSSPIPIGSPQMTSPALHSAISTSFPTLSDPAVTDSATSPGTYAAHAPAGPSGPHTTAGSSGSGGIAKKAASLFHRKRNNSVNQQQRPQSALAQVQSPSASPLTPAAPPPHSLGLGHRTSSSGDISSGEQQYRPPPMLKKALSASASLESLSARFKAPASGNNSDSGRSAFDVSPAQCAASPASRSSTEDFSLDAPASDVYPSAAAAATAPSLITSASEAPLTLDTHGSTSSIAISGELSRRVSFDRTIRGHGRSASDSVSPRSPTAAQRAHSNSLSHDTEATATTFDDPSQSQSSASNKGNRIGRVLGKAGSAAKGMWTHVKPHAQHPTRTDTPGRPPLDDIPAIETACR
ncbi:hypothetical protein RI367_003366 [Sorochytrium milnesiophthora]